MPDALDSHVVGIGPQEALAVKTLGASCSSCEGYPKRLFPATHLLSFFLQVKLSLPTMRAAIVFLLPFLGSCRHLAPREVPDVKRDVAVSVCYTYTTTYLTTVSPIASATGEKLL